MEFLKSFQNSLKLKNTHPNLAGGYTSRRPNNFNKEESLNYVLGQSYCNGANGYLLRSVYKDRAIVSFNFSSSPISFLLGQNRQAWPSSSGNTLIVYLLMTKTSFTNFKRNLKTRIAISPRSMLSRSKKTSGKPQVALFLKHF